MGSFQEPSQWRSGSKEAEYLRETSGSGFKGETLHALLAIPATASPSSRANPLNRTLSRPGMSCFLV